MEIKLHTLQLKNFKGLRNEKIEFGDSTNIYADNGVGKSTLMDAFLWLLFGKDSNDKKDFNIKTLDRDGQPIHRLDHEVSGILDVDGIHYHLKRVYKENWVKPRGAVQAEFSGHTTDLFFNEVPVNAGEYQKKVSGILDESIFKLITNPLYFNSLKWTDQRSTLMDIAGEIKEEEIFDAIINVKNKGQFTALINALNQKKRLDEYKREIASKKSLIKKEMDQIPPRIDELMKSKPGAVNWKEAEKLRERKNEEVKIIEEALIDKQKQLQQKFKTIEAFREQANEKRRELKELEHSAKLDAQIANQDSRKYLREMKTELDNQDAAIKQLELGCNRIEHDIQMLEQSLQKRESDERNFAAAIDAIRDNFHKINAETFKMDEADCACPTCKRPFPEDDLSDKREKLQANFNNDKLSRLEATQKRGLSLKNEMDQLAYQIVEYKNAIEDLRNELKEKRATLEAEMEKFNKANAAYKEEYIKPTVERQPSEFIDTKKVKALELAIEQLEKKAEEASIQSEDEEKEALKQKRNKLLEEISILSSTLSQKAQLERIETRIKELLEQENNMANELAELEGVEYSIQQFTKAKMDLIEERINSKFEFVKFKLFETQINGQEVETCQTLLFGVPWPDLNTAGKITAGIDIINALTKHYQTTAPIWLDNRESVFEIPYTESQVVNLIASKEDKKLRVQAVMAVEYEN